MTAQPDEEQRRQFKRWALASNLDLFVRWAFPLVDPDEFQYGIHIGLICAELEAVARGETSKLMINVPPGHMKSLLVSVFWPVWTWIRDPGRRFVSTAYREPLALRDADRARVLIRHPEFQYLFGDCFTIRKDQDTARRYSNSAGGYRYSCAVAGIMGEGGDYVILDDPHNVEQAESDDVRDETVRKLKLALPTRVRSKDGAIVCIMQRLHERDFCGVMMTEERDQWRHLCLPARYEPDHPYVSDVDPRTEDGQLLNPDLFGEDRIKRLEQTLGSYGTAGQLQQRPAPREGGMFKRSDFNVVERVPAGVRWVRGWDFAASKDEKAARTASVKMGIYRKDGETRYIIGHAFADHLSPGQVQSKLVSTAHADGRGVQIDIPQDPGQAGKAQVKQFIALLAGYNVRSSPESGDKIQRAEAFAAQVEAGFVDIVQGDWTKEYLDEVCAFWYGRFADQVDASSRAFHRLLNPEARIGRTRGT